MRACEIMSVNILLLHQEVQPCPSERRPTLATLAWISNVISTKALFMHLKKKKELNIWSMAEVFSLAVLHLPRVSCAFASTPGCESCAWSVNVKTFHYEAGRLFWSCPFWQLWNICPHKTFSVQSISQFSMSQSFFSLQGVCLIHQCWEQQECLKINQFSLHQRCTLLVLWL